MNQDVSGDSWEEMLFMFRRRISELYKGWYHYLGDSLDPEEKAYFESIRLNTASQKADWMDSLRDLSAFLARKSGRKVIVLIDEYEAPVNHAYEENYFDKLRPSYPSQFQSRLRIVI